MHGEPLGRDITALDRVAGGSTLVGLGLWSPQEPSTERRDKEIN